MRYTPRKFVRQPERKLLVIIENHQGAYAAEEREAAKKEFFEAVGMGENGSANAERMEMVVIMIIKMTRYLMSSMVIQKLRQTGGFLASQYLIKGQLLQLSCWNFRQCSCF